MLTILCMFCETGALGDKEKDEESKDEGGGEDPEIISHVVVNHMLLYPCHLLEN
jgi:hypothetical protein